jgi:hypothetical protein
MVLYLHIPHVFHYMKLGQRDSCLYFNAFSNSLHFYSDYEFESYRTVNYIALCSCDMVSTLTKYRQGYTQILIQV